MKEETWLLRITRHSIALLSLAEYPSQERPPGMHRDAPHAAAAAAHGQVQNMARQPRRPGDRMARPGGPGGVRPGMPGGGFGGYTAPQAKGSGAMGIIMPIYTVGIVIFFVYTIMRVMFKRQPSKEPPARVSPPRDVKPPAAFTGYRLQQPDAVDSRGVRPAGRPAAEPLLERRAAARTAAPAPAPAPAPKPTPAPAIPAPAPAHRSPAGQ
ncbi:hypothetical protein FJT64_016064 [Amphibalanus amphitrite]|uniref:Resistance to inhibitors of cholinesterase protein 3 N-terminal domain-containing protein n=1 Tax=Amphibalanus amphitrite TaxID=1232801 RepID=A0A6A4X7H3_AMPAM|nr:hypothetical protein FJT64_016064 [Amphibalanus amphitrite]